MVREKILDCLLSIMTVAPIIAGVGSNGISSRYDRMCITEGTSTHESPKGERRVVVRDYLYDKCAHEIIAETEREITMTQFDREMAGMGIVGLAIIVFFVFGIKLGYDIFRS